MLAYRIDIHLGAMDDTLTTTYYTTSIPTAEWITHKIESELASIEFIDLHEPMILEYVRKLHALSFKDFSFHGFPPDHPAKLAGMEIPGGYLRIEQIDVENEPQNT